MSKIHKRSGDVSWVMARIKIVPVKKTENGYVACEKTEYLACEATVTFYKNIDAADLLKLITCDYSDMRYDSGIHTGTDGVETVYSSVQVLNYCPKHNWKKAADSGYAHIMDYAVLYDKSATCTNKGVETYYCTLCERYETRSTSALEHNYYWDYKVEPTKTTQGYTVYTCTRCNDSYKAKFVDKLTDTEQTQVTKPKKPVLISVKSPKKKVITVKWKRDKSVTGYIIQYSTDEKFKKGVKKITLNKNKITSTKIKKLKSKKNYYVRLASYKKSNGEIYKSSFTKAKKVKGK